MKKSELFDKNKGNDLEMIIYNSLQPLVHNLIKSEITALSSNITDKKVVNQAEGIELITINECTALIPGISYYTVRQLAEQKKIKSFRTGQGKHGKILIFKDSFLNFFKGEKV